jgi:hypothetical protein
MERAKLPAVLAVLLLVNLSAAIYAQTTNRDEIRAKIAELERRMKDLDDALHYSIEFVTTYDSNRYVFFGMWPVERTLAERRLATLVLLGQMTPQQVLSQMQESARLKKAFVAELKRDVADVTRELEKARNDRSYFINELARLGEAKPGATAGCGLGVRWSVQELISGVWERRGESNLFDGTWGNYKAVLTITLKGNEVSVDRRDTSDPSTCWYKGRLSPDGKSVSGKYGCSHAAGPFDWTATISCN